MKRFKSYILVFLFAFIFLYNMSLLANDDIALLHNKMCFANFGMGLGSMGVGIEAGYHILKGNKNISLRMSYTADEEIYNISIKDLALLYGLNTRTNKNVFMISAGLAYVEDIMDTRTQSHLQHAEFNLAGNKYVTSTVGLAMEVASIFTISKKWGLGFYTFGNINKMNNFYGLVFSVQYGVLRI